MPAFGQRPLTWLFVIASICVDVVICAFGHGDRPFSYLVIGLLIGQIFVAGSWLVAGEGHRLARGAGFVVAVAGLTTVITLADRAPMRWGHTLGAVAILAAAAAASTALCTLVVRRVAYLHGQRPRNNFRFPLIEVFGWTIVVALASVALRTAQFQHLFTQASQLVHVLAIAATAGLIYALFLSRDATITVPRCLVAVTAIVAVMAIGASSRVRADRDLYYGFWWACMYLGGLILVDRLDRRATTPSPTEPSSLALFSPAVDDDSAA